MAAPPPPVHSGTLPGAWRVVVLLWFVACFNFMARLMITTMHESLVSSIPMSEAQFGLLSSMFVWTYGLLSPWAGFLSDRFSRSRVITISLFAWSAVTALTAYARTVEQLLVMRALMAVFEASYMPAALSLISEYHRGATRAFATSLHMSGAVLGGALAGLGGWLAEAKSWHFAFSMIGSVGLGYAVILALSLRDAPPETDPGPHPERTAPVAAPARVTFRQAIRSLLGQPAYRFVLLFVILVGAVSLIINGWMPTYVRERFHVTQGQAGVAATGFQNVAGLLGLFFAGFWADRWRRRNIRGYLYVTFIGVCCAVPGLILLASTASFFVGMAGLVLFGFCIEFSDSTQMPILCQVVDPRFRATGYGVLNFVQQTTGGLAIYATGVLRDLKVDTGRILIVGGLCQILAASVLLFVKPRR